MTSLKNIFFAAMIPLIALGGLWFPLLGYLAAVIAAVLIIASSRRKRYGCGHLCPRGKFLDVLVRSLSLRRLPPAFFRKPLVRWTTLIAFSGLLIARLVQAWGNITAVGGVFVSMCLLSTSIAILMGILTSPRAWCSICPVGMLQDLAHLNPNARSASASPNRSLAETTPGPMTPSRKGPAGPTGPDAAGDEPTRNDEQVE